jgi:hypothetical protein
MRATGPSSNSVLVSHITGGSAMRCNPKLMVLAILALVAVPAHAAAQSAAFTGTFVLAPEASDNIDKAIERSVEKMNFIKRPIARGRLKKTNPAYNTVSIAHTASEMRIATDTDAPIVTPSDGTTVQWKRDDGEVFGVSTEWHSGKLEQTFKAGDGQRVNVYSLSEDGDTLTLDVTVSSPQLPQPVVYRLVYRRKA